MLWRTFSRPVCVGIKHPSGAYDKIFITVTQLRVCWCGALSQTRGPVCRLQLLLSSPDQSFSGPSPMGLVSILYCLRFETSLFVASYDSQGYGGNIPPRLHTGSSLSNPGSLLPLQMLVRLHRRHQVEQFLCCCVGCHGSHMFSNLLPGSDPFVAICWNLRIRCHGNACLPHRCLAAVYSALPRESA
jgi:hypothetical protein